MRCITVASARALARSVTVVSLMSLVGNLDGWVDCADELDQPLLDFSNRVRVVVLDPDLKLVVGLLAREDHSADVVLVIFEHLANKGHEQIQPDLIERLMVTGHLKHPFGSPPVGLIFPEWLDRVLKQIVGISGGQLAW